MAELLVLRTVEQLVDGKVDLMAGMWVASMV